MRHNPASRHAGAIMRLAGLIDVHVHAREPGAIHKEDWRSCTAAALAGGFVQMLAMPNTKPPLIDQAAWDLTAAAAKANARCDWGLFIGATADNADEAASLGPESCGLKIYACHTFGPLLLRERPVWQAHFERWPDDRPIAVHAEGEVLSALLQLAAQFDRHLHVCHLPTWRDLKLVMAARDGGARITCEVAPHHLLLDTDDIERLGPGRSEVRPRLAPPADRRQLWQHIDEIDCFATDHAPHTAAEKDGPNPPPGFATLEQALAVMLTQVHRGRLTLEQLVERFAHAPRRIFGIAEPSDTWIEVDMDAQWTIPERPPMSRAGWTPFAGTEVRGRVERVVLRNNIVFEAGKVLAEPGFGRPIERPGGA